MEKAAVIGKANMEGKGKRVESGEGNVLSCSVKLLFHFKAL